MRAGVIDFSADKEESVSVAIREWSQEHSVHDAEHGDVCADSEGESEDGGERKTRSVDQDPDRVANILTKPVHQITSICDAVYSSHHTRLTCDCLVTYAPVVADDDRVFKALADPTRRFLLDRLFVRDGRTLTELESELEMTRFGVMKHLRVLEGAGLVVSRRAGREKLHFLNPVPIRLIHDRWIDKYTERHVSALTDLKTQLERKR